MSEKSLSIEEKNRRDLLLHPLVDSLFMTKLNSKKQRLNRNHLTNTVSKYVKVYEWLTIHHLKGRLKRKWANHLKQTKTKNSPPPSTISPDPPPPGATSTQADTAEHTGKGGRPKGSTVSNIKKRTERENEAITEILQLYKGCQKEYEAKGVRTSVGSYTKIHNAVRDKFNLPNSFQYKYDSATKRLKRESNASYDNLTIIGNKSPLYEAENDIIDMMITLGKIGSPVSIGEGVQLINDLIKDTIHQQRLIAYKKKRLQPIRSENGRNRTEVLEAVLKEK
jgi:hypothetical protein